MGKKIIGKCHICGNEKELSWEHIPPKSSGNKLTIKYYTSEELLADDVLSGAADISSKRYHLSQGGLKMQTICEDCNNITGADYVQAYSDFANLIKSALLNVNQETDLNKNLNITCKIKPLNFLKEVIALFCSILPRYTVDLYKFGEYVLDKEKQDFDKNDFELYMYWSTTKKGNYKFVPPTGRGNLFKGFILCAEISAPPLGFILSLTPEVKLGLPSFKNMKDYKFDEEAEYSFSLPLLRPIELFPLTYENGSVIDF